MTVKRRLMSWLRATLCGVLAVVASTAQAHKASDSYLQVDATDQGLSVRWDIALRDLDAAVDLDTDVDGKLTWAEVKAGWPRIQAYALARLTIEGCVLQPTRQALERRNDGAYAVLFLTSDCVAVKPLVISYTLLREVDPTHRGIARITRTGAALVLTLLDPTRPATVATVGSSAAVPFAGIASTAPSSSAVNVTPMNATSVLATPGTGSVINRVAGPTSDAAAPGSGFLLDGIRHILSGYDHVLFLLCLLLPSVMRRTPDGWQPVARLSQAIVPVAGIVSAFTVAHSITLGLAATRVVVLSPAFIEPAIAVTIILAALDNVSPIFPVRRVVVTFFFGLIHGFGFASVLAELNLPTADFAWALLEFNVGLELGQLLIVVSVTALLFMLRQQTHYRSWVIRGGSFAAVIVGVLWLIERTANVSLIPLGS